MPYRITTSRSTAGSRKRRSGCGRRLLTYSGGAPPISSPSAAPARTFQPGFRHLAQVEHLVQHCLRYASGAGQLADRLAGADRLLGDLGGLVVADHRIERRRQHRAALDELRPAFGRLQPLDAALAEVAS